jgi:hypothetical protein
MIEIDSYVIVGAVGVAVGYLIGLWDGIISTRKIYRGLLK